MALAERLDPVVLGGVPNSCFRPGARPRGAPTGGRLSSGATHQKRRPMKIEATCENCERTFLLSQIGNDSDTPGRCPFCGIHFARHYVQVLVETVQASEVAAENLVHVLG